MSKMRNAVRTLTCKLALCLVCLHLMAGVSVAVPELDFTVLPLTSDQRDKVSIRCSVKINSPNYQDYRPYSLTIFKNQKQIWTVLSKVLFTPKSVIQVGDASTTEVKGGKEETSNSSEAYLQMTWFRANETTHYGSYLCVGQFANTHTLEPESALDASLNISDHDMLLRLSQLAEKKERFPDFFVDWPSNTEGWPSGRYALLKPASGCPKDSYGKWLEGVKTIHSESGISPDLQANSEHSQLLRPLFTFESGINKVILRYCVRIEDNDKSRRDWPKGSYCINKKDICPVGFTDGRVYIDEEDSFGNKGSVEGVVPDDPTLSAVHMFCCRKDGFANLPIALPNKSPFYLYRYGGKCQDVVGMSVQEHYVLIDSENSDTNDMRNGTLPDGTLNDVRFDLCYYRPLSINQVASTLTATLNSNS
nr:hypothetical protein BgiMline_021630 [Biomphalaria glabrata]